MNRRPSRRRGCSRSDSRKADGRWRVRFPVGLTPKSSRQQVSYRHAAVRRGYGGHQFATGRALGDGRAIRLPRRRRRRQALQRSERPRGSRHYSRTADGARAALSVRESGAAKRCSTSACRHARLTSSDPAQVGGHVLDGQSRPSRGGWYAGRANVRALRQFKDPRCASGARVLKKLAEGIGAHLKHLGPPSPETREMVQEVPRARHASA